LSTQAGKSHWKERKTVMGRAKQLQASTVIAALLVCALAVYGGETRHLRLTEAVRMALEQNRSLKIARLKVQEHIYIKGAARSGYFPAITNESNALHVTELQALTVPAGAFGTVSGVPIPGRNTDVGQGKNTFYSSGTMIAQPLTQLLRIHAENRVALADVAASRDDLKKAENEIAFDVHALYYGILVAQLQKQAADHETAWASETLRENANNVRGGSALEVSEMQGRAELLQSQQSALTAELQIEDYTAELNDLLGLPLDTKLDLESEEVTSLPVLSKAEYVKAAWEENPEIHSAESAIEKSRAGAAAAKTAYIPDITAFARYSYQDGVPFLVRNFGTFGINFRYTLWDFGKRRAEVRERDTQLAEAEENLEHLKEQTAVAVERSYNKLERTRSMVDVATQVAKLREESERLANSQVQQGVVLISDVRQAGAATYKAKADLLQANLAYLLAWAELERTVGRTPGLASK
jgi:outer membrane protein TolC